MDNNINAEIKDLQKKIDIILDPNDYEAKIDKGIFEEELDIDIKYKGEEYNFPSIKEAAQAIMDDTIPVDWSKARISLDSENLFTNVCTALLQAATGWDAGRGDGALVRISCLGGMSVDINEDKAEKLKQYDEWYNIWFDFHGLKNLSFAERKAAVAKRSIAKKRARIEETGKAIEAKFQSALKLADHYIKTGKEVDGFSIEEYLDGLVKSSLENLERVGDEASKVEKENLDKVNDVGDILIMYHDELEKKLEQVKAEKQKRKDAANKESEKLAAERQAKYENNKSEISNFISNLNPCYFTKKNRKNIISIINNFKIYKTEYKEDTGRGKLFSYIDNNFGVPFIVDEVTRERKFIDFTSEKLISLIEINCNRNLYLKGKHNLIISYIKQVYDFIRKTKELGFWFDDAADIFKEILEANNSNDKTKRLNKNLKNIQESKELEETELGILKEFLNN